jgi:hypothetical protein
MLRELLSQLFLSHQGQVAKHNCKFLNDGFGRIILVVNLFSELRLDDVDDKHILNQIVDDGAILV